MEKKFLSLFIIFFSFSLIFFIIFKNQNKIFKKFDDKNYEKKYYQSQWINPNSKNPISDEDLYAYAGFKYIKGTNPFLINPEAPPLGKYIIGVSIILFKNHRILSLCFAFFSLLLSFFVTYQMSSSFFASSLVIFLTAINSLFQDQLIHSGQLEIYQYFFAIVFVIFFNFYLKNKKIRYLFLSGITLGAFISIKFFFFHFLLFNFWLILFFFFIAKKFKINFVIKTYIFLNIIALATFTLTYWRFFLLGGTIKQFLGAQKWIFLFYQQSKIDNIKILGSYLGLIFINRWRYWSNNYPFIQYENWSAIWPLVFIFGSYSIYHFFKQKSFKKNQTSFYPYILLSFFLASNIFLFFTPIYPRYLLSLFLPLNIFFAINIDKLIKMK